MSLDNDNTTIAVTMSEAVFNTNGGSGALQASDFALSISGGTATLSSATPSSISSSGNVYTLGIGLSGTPNGSEVLKVMPVDNGIYDAVGNEASDSTQSNNTATLNDKLAPTTSSLTIDADNTIIMAEGPKELQLALNALSEYCQAWKLKINIDPSQLYSNI